MVSIRKFCLKKNNTNIKQFYWTIWDKTFPVQLFFNTKRLKTTQNKCSITIIKTRMILLFIRACRLRRRSDVPNRDTGGFFIRPTAKPARSNKYSVEGENVKSLFCKKNKVKRGVTQIFCKFAKNKNEKVSILTLYVWCGFWAVWTDRSRVR